MELEEKVEEKTKEVIDTSTSYGKGMQDGLYYLGFMEALLCLGFGVTELQDILKTKMLIDAEKEMGQKEPEGELEDLDLA